MRRKEDGPQVVEGEPAIAYPWAVIVSVLVVIGGLFAGLPLLMSKIPSGAVAVPVLLLVVPMFPAITGWLQGSMDTRQQGESGLRALPREYVFHLWRFALEITLLLACLPVIAAQLLGVIAAILFIAFAAVLLLALAQQVFDLHLKGVTVFTWADVGFSARLMLGTVAATIASYGLAAVLERVFDKSADTAACINRRVMRWLRRHL